MREECIVCRDTREINAVELRVERGVGTSTLSADVWADRQATTMLRKAD